MNNPQDIKLLFLDLDGTLLSSDLKLSKRNIHALRRASENGVHIVLASGRPAESVLRFANLIGGVQYIIASNGGSIVECPSEHVIKCSEISLLATLRVPQIAAPYNVSVCLYTPLQWFVSYINHHVELEIGRSGTSPIVIQDFGLIESPKIKVMLIGEEMPLKQCEVQISKEPDLQVKWFYTYPEYLEVMPLQTSKGEACEHLINLLGVAPESVMAIGDGVNDLELIHSSSYKVAVANASDSLMSTVEYIAPSNDADGVAVAVDALIFRNMSALAQMSYKACKGIASRATGDKSAVPSR